MQLNRSDRTKAEADEKRCCHQAEILHCEPIEKIADEYIDYVNIPEGDFDNVSKCRYTVPDHWTIGKVYQRLIEDTLNGDDLAAHVIRVYHSWVSDGISDYNTDFYYQPRGYISVDCVIFGATTEKGSRPSFLP